MKLNRRDNVYRFYNNFAKDYDKNRYGSEEQKTTDEITKTTYLSLIDEVKGKKVLDCGCGTGRFSILLKGKGADVFSTDISENMLKVLGSKTDVNLIRSDIFCLPFLEGNFDLVVCSQVLTHLHEYRKPLEEFKRILKRNGIVVFDIRNLSWMGNAYRHIQQRIIGSQRAYLPHYTTIWRIDKICRTIGLRICEYRGIGLSRSAGRARINRDIYLGKSKMKLFAPTLIIAARKVF